ncbi:hypothetical protein ACQBAR_06085 [Propionibacteriaceae bacterium Y1685]
MIAEHVEGADLLIRADPAKVAARLAEPDFTAQWAGGLHLEPYEDRGAEGRRHVVTGVLVGSCEWWVEALGPEAAVVHFWLRGRPTRDGDHLPVREGPGVLGALARRRGRLLVLERTRRWRRAMFRLRTDPP